jgi:peptidoglycan/xylan/chitin deacetylase (PgdA/CDA1 family)
MKPPMNRRRFLKSVGAGMGSLAITGNLPGCREIKSLPPRPKPITHIVTLSFDDGFKKSTLKTAEIHEKFGLSACFNVIATGHRDSFAVPDKYQADLSKGDFTLWNEMQDRGHEVMPHGYKHANLRNMPFEQAKDLIRKCLDIFQTELKNFDTKKAVFNFPYNASNPELERYLPSVVRAFRTGGPPINPMPYPQQVKLTCISHGPGNIDQHIQSQVNKLLAQCTGWLIYNTHGLDGEGWGPITSYCLENLLESLIQNDSVAILPAAHALVQPDASMTI